MFKEVLKELFSRKEGVFTVALPFIVAITALFLWLNLRDSAIGKDGVALSAFLLGFYVVLAMWQIQACYARVQRRHEARPAVETVRRYGCDCNVS